jgi:hypothetical protein
MSRKDRRAEKAAHQVPRQKDLIEPLPVPSPEAPFLELRRQMDKKIANVFGIGFSRRSYNEVGELVNEA